MWHPWQEAQRFMKPWLVSKNWKVDSYVKKVIRAPHKLGRGGGKNTMKGVSDQFMVLYRAPPKGKRKLDSDAWYDAYKLQKAALMEWFGDPLASQGNGRFDSKQVNAGYSWSTDLILDYQPPWKKDRLRDDKGEDLRTGAEKSVKLMQHLLLSYTECGHTHENRPVIWDPYGGTMTMGLACTMLGRVYVASEIDEKVHRFAVNRITSYIAGRLRCGGVATASVSLDEEAMPKHHARVLHAAHHVPTQSAAIGFSEGCREGAPQRSGGTRGT
jgi:hypothetical protein